MWKNNSKHKKLNEEMALASSIRDFAESPLDLHDEEVSDDQILFNLKYLGNTVMTAAPADDKNNKKLKLSKKSQLITTSAIKKIITESKAKKRLQDVNIAISPKGIETFDAVTEEPFLHVPIYNISYCSIDAAHDTIFAFVSSSNDSEAKSAKFEKNTQQFGSPESPSGQLESSSLEDEEGLVLHAFQCQKRKIAHNVTMTVARAFERAFQIYQNEQFLEEIRNKDSKNKENVETQKNAANTKKVDAKPAPEEVTSCLIDLGSENGPQLNTLISKDHTRDYFQTTWVSFE
jgi:low density lipoprotein receptor adapter protein 1